MAVVGAGEMECRQQYKGVGSGVVVHFFISPSFIVKKKWSKGKQKEKVNNAVLFDQGSYDKMLSEVPKFKQITPSVLSERLRINGSLARRAIKDLMARGAIRMVSAHASQQIYTRATNS